MAAALATEKAYAPVGEVDVRDGSLAVAIAGGGPPLILLHGWTLDHRMWQPQIETLGSHYWLIMPDRRGFGRTKAPPDLAREAEDVLRVADALGLDTFALAGLSQGAAVALDVSIKSPDRVAAVALAGTPLPGLVPDPDLVPREEYAALVQQAAIKTMRRNWLQHPLMRVPTPEAERLLAAIVGDYEGRDLLRPSMLPAFSVEQIAALPMPLLAVAGSRDTPWRISCARLLAETAPLGAFASIPHAGHVANVAQPDAFDEALLSFLAAAMQRIS